MTIHQLGYISKVLWDCAEVTKVQAIAVAGQMMFAYWHRNDTPEQQNAEYEQAVAIDAKVEEALSYIRVKEWVYVEDPHLGTIDGQIMEECREVFTVKFNTNPKVNSTVYINVSDIP